MNEEAAAAAGGVPPDVAARLAALERENDRLRQRLGETPAAPQDSPRGPVRHRSRASAAVILIALGAILAPAAVVSAWAERTLTDTDRYVATVAPLADDPAVQSAVAGRLTEAVMERIDVDAVVDGVVDGLTDRDLPPRAATALTTLKAPLTSGVESFVRQTADRLVQSDGFRSAWDQANRVAHEQFIAAMRGSGGDVLQVGEEGQLTIQLAGLIDLLKQRLVERGFGLADNLPTIDATFTIVQTTQLVELRNRYAQVVALGTWLPWIVLVLLGAGVVVAVHHLRALLVAALTLVAAMLVLAAALAVARGLYLDALGGQVARLDAAEVAFDQVATFLRATLRTVGVLGLVVALAAYLGGAGASARSLRGGLGKGLAATRTWAEGRGVSSGPFGAWLAGHRGFARTVVIALAALVLLLASSPTPGLVIGVALAAGLLVIVIELLARPPSTVRDDPS
ncbi:hypothetical protein [Myceligenerans indicum]|uniref:Integral membrane protein n=1 Tax=Myceligenerans indicum TaxID=2593663 RepID=A0ABS1LG52_9MICO|nr:hypothetical protein [Myceligenerans indicum]MBL0885139.1 hypothetical protein [Myceligenerans indicum]